MRAEQAYIQEQFEAYSSRPKNARPFVEIFRRFNLTKFNDLYCNTRVVVVLLKVEYQA
jgi:hypothetical protein